MKLKLKSEYVDVMISCPFTGKIINLTFLDEEMYKYYFDKGHKYLFETIEEKEKKETKK